MEMWWPEEGRRWERMKHTKLTIRQTTGTIRQTTGIKKKWKKEEKIS